MKKLILSLIGVLPVLLYSQETLQSVTTNGANTDKQISVQTPVGGAMYTGRQIGTGYGNSNPAGAIFYAKSDATYSSNVYLYSGYYGTNVNVASGTNTFYVRGDGQGYFAYRVGIGVASPTSTLHVNGNALFASTTTAYNTNVLDVLSYQNGNFQAAVTTATHDAGGRPGYGFHALGKYGSYLYAAGPTDLRLKGDNGADATLWTTANFTPGNYLPITSTASDGYTVGLTTAQKILSVNGQIKTRKLTVTQTGWADYVFDSTYRLAPLSDVANYIQANKHLPDVPSAAAVQKEGVDIGANQVVLLKKIEELTLYTIEQNKVNEKQSKEIEELKAMVKTLAERK